MTRHEMRKCVFCLLFQREFYGAEDFTEQMNNFIQEQKVSEEEETEIREKINKLTEQLANLDEEIASHTSGWKLDRIAKADLAILRLAVYEARYDESVPVGVAVNEAVELAKEFGGDNSPSFVNGVLGKIVNE